MSATGRAPFDAADARRAAAYMRRHGLAIVDPFTEPRADHDLIFKLSLSGARFVMAHSFGTVRADGVAFRAYPVIVGRPSTNAFAVDDAGLQLCGLDIGLGSAAFEIALFVFAQSSLFTEIGNAQGERSPDLPAGSHPAFWMADRLRERGTEDGPVIGIELVPSDAERQRAAQILTQLMLRFVWLHEFYHCLNGHTGLLAARRPGTVLNEMPDASAIGLIEREPDEDADAYRRLRHAMEYDADRSALWMLVRLQQVELEPIAELNAWPKPQRLKLAIFAAAMMTFVFDQVARRQINPAGHTHPIAQHRLTDLVRTLASHLVEPMGGVREAFKAALAEMNALQRRLPQFMSASRLVDDLGSVSLQHALEEIDDGLTEARLRLSHFAFRAANGSLPKIISNIITE